MSYIRVRSCHNSRDRVSRVASDLHRQTVHNAQQQFEQKLTDSERQVRWAIKQRRSTSSSPSEKRFATQHLKNLRSSLNDDYDQLIQAYVHEHKEKVDQTGRYLNQSYDSNCQHNQTMPSRTYRESVHDTSLQYEKPRPLPVTPIIISQRKRIPDEKLTTPRNYYNNSYDDEDRSFRLNRSLSIPDEQVDIAELKGRLARMEYEHREIKQLLCHLRKDLSGLIPQQPYMYRSTVNIPNFALKH